jgi:2-polyprenyl-6-methoxyphenol hydroxylase-like FAD-dependent oxidoreductase
MQEQRVLISGAGIAGLCAALWFNRFGFAVTVVERAAAPRGGGYLVSLSDYAYRAAAELDVLDALQHRNMGITHSSYHNMSGTTLLALDYKKLFEGVDVLQIMRDDVVDVFYQKAKDLVTMRFADTIAEVDQHDADVTVTFASGDRQRYDLVVVAEGQNSPSRQLLLADQTRLDYLGLHCAAMKIPNVLGLCDKFETHMDLGRYMAAFNTPDGELGTVFVWSDDSVEVAEGPDKLPALKAAFANSSTAIAKALDAASPERIYMDSLKQVLASTWSKGRVVCIGDAAHCLTLFSGRGAAAAISGATRLAKQINTAGIDAGIAGFEKQMRSIIAPIQKQTRGAVTWYVPQTRIQQLTRDSAMRWLPNKLFQAYFQMKYSNV